MLRRTRAMTIPPGVSPFVPTDLPQDARWFGAAPETIAAVDGPEASRLIPKIRHVVENYKFRAFRRLQRMAGTELQHLCPGCAGCGSRTKTVLPPTAIGKDYPYRGEWFGLTPSGTGAYASLGGYLGLTIGWVEGLEINFLVRCLDWTFAGPR